MKNKTLGIGIALWLLTGTAILTTTGCAGSRYRQSTGEHIDDRATSSRVESALADDTLYKFPMVEVRTFKGTVQLSGFVTTKEQKNRAEDVAKKVQGVGNLENNITVQE